MNIREREYQCDECRRIFTVRDLQLSGRIVCAACVLVMCLCGHDEIKRFPLTCECCYCGCPEFRASDERKPA